MRARHCDGRVRQSDLGPFSVRGKRKNRRRGKLNSYCKPIIIYTLRLRRQLDSVSVRLLVVRIDRSPMNAGKRPRSTRFKAPIALKIIPSDANRAVHSIVLPRGAQRISIGTELDYSMRNATKRTRYNNNATRVVRSVVIESLHLRVYGIY